MIKPNEISRPLVRERLDGFAPLPYNYDWLVDPSFLGYRKLSLVKRSRTGRIYPVNKRLRQQYLYMTRSIEDLQKMSYYMVAKYGLPK